MFGQNARMTDNYCINETSGFTIEPTNLYNRILHLQAYIYIADISSNKYKPFTYLAHAGPELLTLVEDNKDVLLNLFSILGIFL